MGGFCINSILVFGVVFGLLFLCFWFWVLCLVVFGSYVDCGGEVLFVEVLVGLEGVVVFRYVVC